MTVRTVIPFFATPARSGPGSAIGRRSAGGCPAPCSLIDRSPLEVGFQSLVLGIPVAYAKSLRAQGDPRGIGQLMSDALFARLTGASGTQGSVNVEVGLVMSERTLLRGGTDPAVLTDDEGRTFAHVPAVLARALVRQADRAWLSRLYAAPHTRELVAMDSRRRLFTGRLRRLLVLRDQTCRMPWCEAPIRHADHTLEHASGGPTTLGRGQGCASRATTSSRPPAGTPR